MCVYIKKDNKTQQSKPFLTCLLCRAGFGGKWSVYLVALYTHVTIQQYVWALYCAHYVILIQSLPKAIKHQLRPNNVENSPEIDVL